MNVTLASTISFCDPGGRRVFLDIGNDRYFSLGPATDAAFSRAIAVQDLSDDDVARLQILEQAGLLTIAAGATPPRACEPPPLASGLLDCDNLPPPALSQTLSAAWRLRRAKIAVRRTPLETLCDRFSAFKGKLGGHPVAAARDTAVALAVAFQSAVRLVGAREQCLALSFALATRAVELRLPADILLGVKLRPFEAHAWVQVDGMLVSDRLEAVRPFTPILVL